MQTRRRTEKNATRAPYGDSVAVPPEYWEQLRKTDLQQLCPRAAVMVDGDGGILVTAFNKEIRDHHLPADAIWGIVSVTTDMLLNI